MTVPPHSEEIFNVEHEEEEILLQNKTNNKQKTVLMFVFQTLMHEILSVINVAAGKSGDNYVEGILL